MTTAAAEAPSVPQRPWPKLAFPTWVMRMMCMMCMMCQTLSTVQEETLSTAEGALRRLFVACCSFSPSLSSSSTHTPVVLEYVCHSLEDTIVVLTLTVAGACVDRALVVEVGCCSSNHRMPHPSPTTSFTTVTAIAFRTASGADSTVTEVSTES